MRTRVWTGWSLTATVVTAGLAAPATGEEPMKLTLKDHAFQPAELTVPAGQRLHIVVENQDATPEEFESSGLRAEKVVVPGGRITVTVGPLKPGRYDFWGEYHKDTARGTLTAVTGTN